MRADIDRKEAEYREWFERKLPEVKAPKIEQVVSSTSSSTSSDQ